MVMTEVWIIIGPGKDLVPDSTKPLPELMLTYHRLGPVLY